MVKSTKKLPPSQPLARSWVNAKYLGNGLLAPGSVGPGGLAFLHVPPIASQKPVEGWTIPPFPFEIFGYAVYLPENVLAVAEQGEK